MIDFLKRIYVRFKLRIVDRELQDSSIELQEAKADGDYDTVAALVPYISELRSERHYLRFRLKLLTPTAKKGNLT